RSIKGKGIHLPWPGRFVPHPPQVSISPTFPDGIVRKIVWMDIATWRHQGCKKAYPVRGDHLFAIPSALVEHQQTQPRHVACGKAHRILAETAVGQVFLFLLV